MAKYALTCLDYRLPDGQEFTVTFCGYSGKVRYLVIGPDPLRHLRASVVNVTGSECQSSKHCLAVKCPLNNTPPQHLAHILEMMTDETLDDKTARICGTHSAVDHLVKFADKMSELFPENLREKEVQSS